MVAPKYSIVEHERRFVVDDARRPPLDFSASTLIDDLYFAGGLRLRSISTAGVPPILKLAKKYPGLAPMSRPMTNIYLNPGEFDLLATLPGRRLRKRRYRVDVGSRNFVVDVFADKLAGLVLAEIEADAATVRSVAAPEWALAEVTDDPHFQGGCLSGWTAADLAARRARFG